VYHYQLKLAGFCLADVEGQSASLARFRLALFREHQLEPFGQFKSIIPFNASSPGDGHRLGATWEHSGVSPTDESAIKRGPSAKTSSENERTLEQDHFSSVHWGFYNPRGSQQRKRLSTALEQSRTEHFSADPWPDLADVRELLWITAGTARSWK